MRDQKPGGRSAVCHRVSSHALFLSEGKGKLYCSLHYPSATQGSVHRTDDVPEIVLDWSCRSSVVLDAYRFFDLPYQPSLAFPLSGAMPAVSHASQPVDLNFNASPASAHTGSAIQPVASFTNTRSLHQTVLGTSA